MDLRTAVKWYLHREEKKQNKREQRHIAVFVVESANIRVVSSVQI